MGLWPTNRHENSTYPSCCAESGPETRHLRQPRDHILTPSQGLRGRALSFSFCSSFSCRITVTICARLTATIAARSHYSPFETNNGNRCSVFGDRFPRPGRCRSPRALNSRGPPFWRPDCSRSYLTSCVAKSQPRRATTSDTVTFSAGCDESTSKTLRVCAVGEPVRLSKNFTGGRALERSAMTSLLKFLVADLRRPHGVPARRAGSRHNSHLAVHPPSMRMV